MNKKIYIAMILDESGSMSAIRKSAMKAYNEQVQAIHDMARGDRTTCISLIKFGTTPTPMFWNKPVNKLHELTDAMYSPRGLTAMLDAVGLAIDTLKVQYDADDEDTSFLIIIVSDGEENNSKQYTYKTIAERIQDLQDTKRWTFTYLGANQDLSKIQDRMKIPQGNISNFSTKNEVYASHTIAKAAEGTRNFFVSYDSGVRAVTTHYHDVDITGKYDEDKIKE